MTSEQTYRLFKIATMIYFILIFGTFIYGFLGMMIILNPLKDYYNTYKSRENDDYYIDGTIERYNPYTDRIEVLNDSDDDVF